MISSVFLFISVYYVYISEYLRILFMYYVLSPICFIVYFLRKKYSLTYSRVIPFINLRYGTKPMTNIPLIFHFVNLAF